jgi:cytochrome c oxidase cbb3-type subunit 1
VIATGFWGIVGFLAGTFVPFNWRFPRLVNGRSRLVILAAVLHTSAVIFAFGGNALIMSSFYVVQRTCGTRLWGGNLRWFVFWGYPAVHRAGGNRVSAGCGHDQKEYAGRNVVC